MKRRDLFRLLVGAPAAAAIPAPPAVVTLHKLTATEGARVLGVIRRGMVGTVNATRITGMIPASRIGAISEPYIVSYRP